MKLLPAAAGGSLLVAGAAWGAADISGAVARGAVAFQKCYACHSAEPGGDDLSGPNLHAIAGRPIASRPGFEYSPALTIFARRHKRWNDALLDRFIADPEHLVPRTSMSFVGIKNGRERANLIAYLKAMAKRPRPRK